MQGKEDIFYLDKCSGLCYLGTESEEEVKLIVAGCVYICRAYR